MMGAGARDEGMVVFDPRGTVIAKTANHHENGVSARIPIADFRKTRRLPEFPMALMLPVFQQYEPGFQPNAFLERPPATCKDASSLARESMGTK